LGWSQQELAPRARIRLETLRNTKSGKQTPSEAAMAKIDSANNKGQKPRR
jgi:ribosome-binding protein aMBF1 (putative translation factor)